MLAAMKFAKNRGPIVGMTAKCAALHCWRGTPPATR
jgi:hypothetical protein